MARKQDKNRSIRKKTLDHSKSVKRKEPKIKDHPLLSASSKIPILNGLSLILQEQAKVFGKKLYHKFGLGLDSASPPSVLTMTWFECCEKILNNDDTIGSVISMAPFNERFILLFEKNVVYSLVESMLGGSKRLHPLRIAGREFSALERSLLENITALAISTLKKAFLPLEEIKCELEKLDLKPSASLVLLSQEMVTISKVSILVNNAENDVGKIHLIMPHSSVHEIRSKLIYPSYEKSDEKTNNSWFSHFAHCIKNLDIYLKAEVDSKSTNLRDVSKLSVGNTIMIDQNPSEDIEIRVNDFVIGSGKLGKSVNNVAIEITETFFQY